MTGNAVIDILAPDSFHTSFDKVPACQFPFRMSTLSTEKMKDAICKLKKRPFAEYFCSLARCYTAARAPQKRAMFSTTLL